MTMEAAITFAFSLSVVALTIPATAHAAEAKSGSQNTVNKTVVNSAVKQKSIKFSPEYTKSSGKGGSSIKTK